jgi:hypothetical protein
MFKVVCLAAVMTVGFVSHAYADAFRPGSSPAGGRIGRVCNSEFLSRPEQMDCVEKMKAAKTDAERKEIRDLIRENQKERQKERDRQHDNVNIGGPNANSAIQQ